MEEKFGIDPELNEVLPELSEEDYTALEKSLLSDGYKGAPIMVWGDVIVDGHNRYEICNKHHIPYEVKKIDVRAKLAELANVSTDTYSRGKKILDSGNKELIEQTLKGQKTINKAYNELKASQKKESDEKKVHDNKSELQDLKENKRKEVAKKVRESREKYGIESPEYDEAKAEQLNVEIQINELENLSRNSESISKVELIQKRYSDYLNIFQEDIQWLLSMEFYKNDEEVTSSIHSDLRNCLEKFKGIETLIKSMMVDELGCIVINKS